MAKCLRCGADNSWLQGRVPAEESKLRSALEYIAELEPGSRGAYSKFSDAQRRAKEALQRLDHDMVNDMTDDSLDDTALQSMLK